MRAFLLSVAVMLVVGLTPTDKPAAVAIITRYGSVLPHEGTVTLEVTITPNKMNRSLFTAIESEGYAASTYEALYGIETAKTRQVPFKDLPDGSYTGWAHLIQEHGQQSASVTFIVGSGDEDFP